MTDAMVARLREICLALPGVEERPFGGHTSPSFRVRNKIFAMVNEAETALTLKAPPGAQGVLVGANAARFFVPAYVGRQGWVGLRLDRDLDWDEVAALVEQSYRMTAPKQLLAVLTASSRVP